MRHLFAVAVLATAAVYAQTAAPTPPLVRIVGQPQVVFDWSRDACAPDEIPDTPARAFRDASGRVQLLIAHERTRRLIGTSLDRLHRDCTVVFDSAENADPAAFEDREWLASPYALPGGRTVVALVHDEYQGNTHPGRCPSGSYRRCWYNAITLAVSNDGGDSYVQARPPARLVAAPSRRYVPDAGPIGVFEPSNIIGNPLDHLFYVLVHVIGPGGTPIGTCVMRTANLLAPGSWRAWDGRTFGLRSVDPYRRRGGTPCTVVSKVEIIDMHESLTFNTWFREFLLIGVSVARDSATGKPVPGIYYSLSRDLVTWSARRLLLAAPVPWIQGCSSSPALAYPAALDPASPSRNFDTTGSRFYLYVTRFNGGCSRPLDRDLVRFPVEVVTP